MENGSPLRTKQQGACRRVNGRMRHDAAYFRAQAKDCREQALTARDRPTIKYLIQMAEDFEEEARVIDRAKREKPE